MITDPVLHVSPAYFRGYRVTRGICFFTRRDLLSLGVGVGASGAPLSSEYDRNRHGSRGFRLSLSLPCNTMGSVVQ